MSRLDQAPEWSDVEERVKRFIRRLLCLDEKFRPTATEALHDPWFSAGYKKESSERQYESSVKNWKATTPVFDFVENLKPFIANSIPREDVGARLYEGVKGLTSLLSQDAVYFPITTRKLLTKTHPTQSAKADPILHSEPGEQQVAETRRP